jgi:hypothetical protein
MGANKLISYSRGIDAADTAKAAATIKTWLVPDANRPRFIRADGDCPRCGHHISYDHWLQIQVAGVTFDRDVLGASGHDRLLDSVNEVLDDLGVSAKGDETFTMSCNCGEDHPGHPDGQLSCGSQFNVRTLWP